MSWINIFGGSPIKPAAPAFEAIALTANTALVWPLETVGGVPTVAAEMAVTPSITGLSLSLPDATQGSTGVVSLVYNPGSHSFTLRDNGGDQIVVIAPGIAWLISLTDNTTADGSWQAIQMGALTSTADAGALAGLGLQALASQLQSSLSTFYFSANQLIDLTYRASGVVWQGATAGTFQLDLISSLTTGWWALFTNNGTDSVTLTTSGSDTINGVAQIVIPAGGEGNPYSLLVIAASDGFNTFAGTPAIIPISGGGTGADNADDALTNLGGSAIGIDIFEAPNAAAILAILGIGASAFQEVTVASNQVLTPSSINSAFVCTAPVQLTLPDSTTVTDQFVIAAYAQGGAVTFGVSNAADKINNGTAAANFVISQGSSLVMVTDGANNWWPLFLYAPDGIPWCVATGSADAIALTFSPADTVLRDGMLRSFQATAANVTTAPTIDDGGLGLRVVTKNGGQPLAPKDIPGSGAQCFIRYKAATTSWELMNPTINLDLLGNAQGNVLFRGASAWQAIAPGSLGQVLMSGGPAADVAWGTNSGRLLSITTYFTAGSYTYDVPDGCTMLVVDLIGAGAGGGGAAVGMAAHVPGGGSGGGGGARTQGLIGSLGPSYNVVVGLKGTGGVGATVGTPGALSSFGSALSCNGGAGGTIGTNPGSGEVGDIAVTPAAATVINAGNIRSSPGRLARFGQFQNRGFATGGDGGDGLFGGGGLGGQVTTDTAGQVNGLHGGAPGAGGGGAAVYSQGADQTANGGDGADGGCIIYAFS